MSHQALVLGDPMSPPRGLFPVGLAVTGGAAHHRGDWHVARLMPAQQQVPDCPERKTLAERPERGPHPPRLPEGPEVQGRVPGAVGASGHLAWQTSLQSVPVADGVAGTHGEGLPWLSGRSLHPPMSPRGCHDLS